MEIFFTVLAVVVALAIWRWIKNVLATLIVGKVVKDQMRAENDAQELREACCAAIEKNIHLDDYQLLRTEIITRQAEREFGPIKQLVTRNEVIDKFIEARMESTLALWNDAHDAAHGDE